MKLKREAFGDCIADIAEAADVDQGTAFDILQHVADHGERIRAAGQENPFAFAAEDIAQKAREAAARDRADALRNALVRNSIMERIRQNGGLANAVTTLRSLLHGTNRDARDSVQALWRGNAANWTGVLSNRLRQAGLEKAAISGDLDKEIAQALWAMNAGEKVPAEVSSAARTVAEAIQPALDFAKDRLNAAGARIGDAADYVAHTTHDSRLMRRAAGPGKTPEEAFEAWWQFTEPRLAEKTFEGVTPEGGESIEAARRRFGRSVFEGLVTGIHKTFAGMDGVDVGADQRVPPSFEGSYNVARKASQPRVLLWKDGAAWHDYAQRFGDATSLSDGVMKSLDRSARQLALMEKFGTNPAGNLNMILRNVQEEYRGDIDGIKAFGNKVRGIQNVMGRLDGSLNIPASEGIAHAANAVRTWESISSLGGVGVTHFASIWPTVTSEMVHHGQSRLATLGKLASALVPSADSAGRKEILADLGAYSAGLTRDMESRWQADDPIPGKVASIASTFMKFTGIHYVFDNTQRAIREMLSHQLGRNAGLEYGALDPRLQKMLGMYRIAPEDWDVLRAVPDLPTEGGRAYMTPSSAYRADPAAVEALLRQRGEIVEGAAPDSVSRAVQHYQWGLGDKLSSYYSDAAAHGVVTPGVQERAAVLGDTRPGTVNGELFRFLTQFKMWPLAAINQVINREIWLATSKGAAAFGIGSLVASSMAGGYLRMCINDVAIGNPIRNPTDPKTMMAALAQGGGIGILGDFLFGETNRMGGGFLSTLGGPVIGDVAKLYDIYARFRDEAADDDPDVRAKALQHAWPELLRFGIKHIPFANLIYLKGALDYMLFYHLYEAASPGWWDRTNARVQKETGRTMMGYTPGGNVPYGVPGAYLTDGGAGASGLLATQH